MQPHHLNLPTAITVTSLVLAFFSRDVSSAKILLYPFAHCPNSHLLNMEKLVAILLKDAHDVTMFVPDTYEPDPYNTHLSQVHFTN